MEMKTQQLADVRKVVISENRDGHRETEIKTHFGRQFKFSKYN